MGFAHTRFIGVRGFAPPESNVYHLKSNVWFISNVII